MANFDITTGQVIIRAGKYVSTDFTDAQINNFVSGACSLVNTMCRYNFSDNYTTLNPDVKHILQSVAIDLAAMDCVTYDMSGYTTRTEAENVINILRDSVLRGLSILRDKKAQDFINAT